MESTTATLLGALIGATTGLAGSLFSQIIIARKNNRVWVRSKKDESYSNTIRYCLRARNKRSKITAEGETILEQDIIKEWFDDISETIIWGTSLTIYCDPSCKNEIENIVEKLRGSFETMLGHVDIETDNGIKRAAVSIKKKNDYPGLFFCLTELYETTKKCARNDIGK